ncbi:MAG: PHP domain-containing protein [Actinomycetota bacterium]|nr:PHP domain-containing protein [Actinomycetota bacterium]
MSGAPLSAHLNNAGLAELLGLEADAAEGHRKRALGRASSAALLWAEEAAGLPEQGRSLTELEAVGPGIERRLTQWLKDPPEVPEPPPARRGFNTFAAARAEVASQQEWRSELKADLQMHTTWSDGNSTLPEMATACAARGLAYIAITDHSGGMRVPRGMDSEQLAEQGRAIERLNEGLGSSADFRVLRAIEMNIDAEGQGDMDPAVLPGLDLVLGSFHSALRVAEDSTQRYLTTLRNPNIDVIGHPRGRRYSRRPGLNADWERVFAEAASLGKAVEINSHPHRQDLSDELLPVANASGVMFTIGTDSHDPSELRFVDMALSAAMKAGIERPRILNYRTCADLQSWVASHR